MKGDMLLYYRGSNDTKPLGTVTLPQNKVLRHGEDPKQPGCFKFEVVSCNELLSVSQTHDTFQMCADSEKDMDSWIDAINRVLYEPYGGGMFCRPLDDTMAVECRLGGRYVPLLIHKCAEFIRKHGLSEVGVFRLPGQATRVQEMREIFNQGVQYDFEDSEDVHTVASLLKLYLRELPVPLVEFSLYDSFSKATRWYNTKPEETVKEFRRLLLKLNKWNYNLLKYITRLLHEVRMNSEMNKMTASNLGTVFGPNLLRPESEDPLIMMECAAVLTTFVVVLIENQETLFPVNDDEKPPIRLSVIDVPANALSGLLSKGLSSAGFSTSVQMKPTSPPPTATFPRSSSIARSTTSPSFRDLSKKEQNRMSMGDYTATLPPRVPPVHRASSPEIINESGVRTVSPPRTSPGKTVFNSVPAEMKKMDNEIAELKVALAKARKSAKLWRRRYDAEHNARETAEFRITELRQLLDETFKQFVEEDEEEDDEEMDGTEEVAQL